MKLQGRVFMTIADGGDDRYLALEVTDDRAAIRFLRVKIPLDKAATFLVGHQEVEAEVELRGMDKVGLVREWKTELVPYDCYQSPKTEEHIDSVLAPFEVDGWIASRGDLQNGHNLVAIAGGRHQRVRFERWVPAPVEPERDPLYPTRSTREYLPDP